MMRETPAPTVTKVHIEFTRDEIELLRSGLTMLLESYTRHEHMYGKIHDLLARLDLHAR